MSDTVVVARGLALANRLVHCKGPASMRSPGHLQFTAPNCGFL